MSLNSERLEVDAVVTRLLDNLSLTITSKSAREGSEMRRQIGEVRAFYLQQIKDGTFSQQLLDCFVAARKASVSLASLAYVRQQLFTEVPAGEISSAVVMMAIGFCLSAESQLITAMTFKSRTDIEALMLVMTTAFSTARDLAADSDDSSFYQNLTFLGGALINYLATAERPLPQMISFVMPSTLPALTLSNRIYYTASRWEEIIDENKTIHPAFCQRNIIGMSS